MDNIRNIFYHPEFERCGFILKSGAVKEVKNISLNPRRSFEFPEDELQAHVEETLAFWHSHPKGNANLSVEDYLSFLNYPKHLHVIFCYDKYAVYGVRNNLVIRLDYANNSEFSRRFEELVS